MSGKFQIEWGLLVLLENYENYSVLVLDTQSSDRRELWRSVQNYICVKVVISLFSHATFCAATKRLTLFFMTVLMHRYR